MAPPAPEPSPQPPDRNAQQVTDVSQHVPDASGDVAAADQATKTMKAMHSAPDETHQFANPAPLAALVARDITAWFGERMVLEGVSLTMAAGRVTSLIGPSGCGKSTF